MGIVPLMGTDWRKAFGATMASKKIKMKPLSLRAGLGETFVRDMLERGRDPTLENFLALCDEMNVTVAEAIGEPPRAAEGQIAVPAYRQRAAAGAGSVGEPIMPDHFLMFREHWLRRMSGDIKQLVVIDVEGDSMLDTLHAGDHVLVDRSQRNPRREGLYILRVDDVLQVKRLSVHPVSRLLTIKSDNPQYETHRDVNPDEIDIFGRVIWIGRNLG